MASPLLGTALQDLPGEPFLVYLSMKSDTGLLPDHLNKTQ
jgi:hypothetical protein